MKGYVPSVARIWVIAAVVIAGVLVVAFVSRHVIVSNTAEAFNRQQLFLNPWREIGQKTTVPGCLLSHSIRPPIPSRILPSNQ